MYEQDSNVKLVIRIRNPKEDVPKKNGFDETLNSIKVPPTSSSKTPSSKNATQNTKQATKNPPAGKSKPQTPIVKEEVKKPAGLKENVKYTIFTANEPSDTVCISNKAIAGRLINTSCRQTSDLYDYSHNLMKDSTLLEYSRVYNETHPVDSIYIEQIKDKVSNLFQGRNSSVIFFGPSEGGKSYLCRGLDPEDGGLLGKSAQELLNLIEMSLQANSEKQTKSTFFAAGFSCYQIYNDSINDLLSTNPVKQLQIRTYYDHDSGQCFTQIVDLVKKDIKTKKDFDDAIAESVHNRKLLAQTMKVNELKTKSHIVFSLLLEKRDKINEGVNKVLEKSIEKFAQMDFVELASSDIGLPSIKLSENEYQTNDDINAKTVSKNFDSLSNNLVASATNTPATKDTKLTLALKPTLKPESDNLLFGCVHSSENPPTSSMKALKFINWIRNQIENVGSGGIGLANDVSGGFASSSKKYIPNQGQNNQRNNPRKKTGSISKMEDSDVEVNNDEVEYFKNRNAKGKSNRRIESEAEDFGERDLKPINERKNVANTPAGRAIKNVENLEDAGIVDYSPSPNNKQGYRNRNSNQESFLADSKGMQFRKKTNDLDKTAKNLENQSNELTRQIENLRNKRSKLEDHSRLGNYSIIGANPNEYENEKIRQEFYTLKSDNILYKEEINLLLEKNQRLEEDLKNQHLRNLELASEVEKVIQEKNQKQQEIEKIKDDQVKARSLDSNLAEQFNFRFSTETKIRELENENRKNFEEKQKYEIELRVIQERYNELKRIHEISETELNQFRHKKNDELNSYESKLIKANQELEFLHRENNALRLNEERLRYENSNIEKHRDHLNEKYQDYKGKCNILTAKLADVEDEVKRLLYEKTQDVMEKKKDEGSRRSKQESKQRILSDMQTRIAAYKNNLMKNRTNRDESP